jgi:ABC-type polysaccharide/polyol phosphate transport system ATPase subunit
LIERSSIVVLASQSVDLIRRICSRAILLDHGRVIADGPTEEVLEIHSRMNRETPGNKPGFSETPVEPGQAAPIAVSAN